MYLWNVICLILFSRTLPLLHIFPILILLVLVFVHLIYCTLCVVCTSKRKFCPIIDLFISVSFSRMSAAFLRPAVLGFSSNLAFLLEKKNLHIWFGIHQSHTQTNGIIYYYYYFYYKFTVNFDVVQAEKSLIFLLLYKQVVKTNSLAWQNLMAITTHAVFHALPEMKQSKGFSLCATPRAALQRKLKKELRRNTRTTQLIIKSTNDLHKNDFVNHGNWQTFHTSTFFCLSLWFCLYNMRKMRAANVHSPIAIVVNCSKFKFTMERALVRRAQNTCRNMNFKSARKRL